MSARRIRSGVVVLVSQRATFLLDVVTRERTLTPPGDLHPLVLGSLGDEQALASLSDNLYGPWFSSDAPLCDPWIEKTLGALDERLLGPHASRFSPRVSYAYRTTLAAHAMRRRFTTSFGQFPVLPETALRRALRVGDAELVGKKRVLCLGDDDLTSVALAALGHEVVSLDIDDYVLRLVAAVAERFALPIAARRYDARQPVPKDLGLFDAFVTDPMSNRECFELFLSRAIALLRPDGRGFVAVHPAAWRAFEAVVEKLGVRIAGHWRKHNRYYSESFLQELYESDWAELSLTEATKPSAHPDKLAMPIALYQEDIAQRLPQLRVTLDGIDYLKNAMPAHLDLLIALLEAECGFKLAEREDVLGQDFTFIAGAHEHGGSLAFYVQRKTPQVLVVIEPYSVKIEETLRDLLVRAYKHSLESVRVTTTRYAWDMRLR